jgi:DNA-binding LacI/PurR family transcriptional regulator
VETSAQERLYGYRRARELFGFPDEAGLIMEDCKSRMDEGYRAAVEILKNKPLPTAILAYNDLIAIGAMDAVKQQGLSIPKDISVVGFDDISLASEVNPTLTTVHVPKRTMGMVAVKELLAIIKGKEEAVKKSLIPTNLIVRRSTDIPCSP